MFLGGLGARRVWCDNDTLEVVASARAICLTAGWQGHNYLTKKPQGTTLGFRV